jgi:predicted HTH transcriptional regulator
MRVDMRVRGVHHVGMSEVHQLATELAAIDKTIARHRLALAVARERRAKVRAAITEAILSAIEENPEETNVSIAARFGLRSETSVRNIRNTRRA